MKKQFRKVVFRVLLAFMLCQTAVLVLPDAPAVEAHSGRTDSSGGHRDNKNVSGLGYYHYHCGGHPAHLHSGGVCPYSSSGASSSSSSSSSRSPKLSKTSVSINKGKSYTLKLNYVKSGKNVKWSTSNKKVASIKAKGSKVVITGKKAGKATITAKYNGRSYKCKVTIRKVKSHVLSASATQVTIADEGQVKITFTEKGTLEYDVDDWDIADCEWGEWKGNTIPLYLTGYENGTTVITISNTYNNEKLYINVTVELDSDSEEW